MQLEFTCGDGALPRQDGPEARDHTTGESNCTATTVASESRRAYDASVPALRIYGFADRFTRL